MMGLHTHFTGQRRSAAQGPKTGEWRDRLQQRRKSRPKPHLNYQRVLSKSLRVGSSRRTSNHLSKISPARRPRPPQEPEAGPSKSQPPRATGSPNRTRHLRGGAGGAREQETGGETGGCPRPPRTPRSGRERSSERPGLPRLTRLNATPGGQKQYSPAKTSHKKADCPGARASGPSGKGSCPRHN